MTKFKDCDEFIKRFSYHTIEYAFNVDRLTVQFFSKVREQGCNSLQFEQSIGVILTDIKASISELADSVRDRVSQYLSAADVLPTSSMNSLIKKSSVMLEECLKSSERRNELKKKAESVNKELADMSLRSPAKKDPSKETLQKQLKSKFDLNTTELNMLMNQFSLFFKECLEGAKHYQSVVNGMVLVGFDKLAHVYKDWSTKLSSHVFPKASEMSNSISILDVKLEGIPTNWVHVPPQELSYDQYMQSLEFKRMHTANTSLLADIGKSLQRHRASLKVADCAKIEIYVMQLLSPRLTEVEETLLDNEIGLRLDQENFASYFLLTLNLQLITLGKQNHKVTKRTFIGLKNKFLLMLSNIESGDVRMNNVGVLIYNAARICYEEDEEEKTIVTLIQHLDCNFMRDPKVWEHYFLFRINRKLIQQNHDDSLREILSPVKKVGSKSFMYSETHRTILKYLQENPELVIQTLKEIVYYLTLSSSLATKARNILITLCSEFEIDKKILGQMLFLEKRFNEAYLNDKIQQVRRTKKTSLGTRGEKLLSVFKQTILFLGVHDKVKLGMLNKFMKNEFFNFAMKETLAIEGLSMKTRLLIYRALIPKRYKPQDFLHNKEAISIHPSCSKIIKLDLDRTCRTKPALYKASELLLYNYLARNETKMAYFQGLNFIATYLVQLLADPVDQLNCLDHVVTNIFGDFVNNKLYRDGLGMLIMFYCLDRVFEMHAKQIFSHMQRESIGLQFIAANPVITIFTWNLDLDILGSPLANLVWDSVICAPSAGTLFKIMIALTRLFEDYLLLCDLEDFLVTWDAFFSTRKVWFFEKFDKEFLESRVIEPKLKQLDVDKIAQGMKDLRKAVDSIDVSEDLLPILFEEYLTLRQDTDAIMKEVSTKLLAQSEMSLKQLN